MRSLVFNPSAVRDGHPRVHAFAESRDGNDLLVGIANGEGECPLLQHAVCREACILLRLTACMLAVFLGGAQGGCLQQQLPHTTLLRPNAPAAVHLLSLRAQLQQPAGSSKPIIAATLNESGAHDGSRCSAVAWVPRSGGAQFLVAHASGNILVYKKVRPGEGLRQPLAASQLLAAWAQCCGSCCPMTADGAV